MGSNFIFFNKVLVDPVNSVQNPLEKHNFAENTFLLAVGPTSENVKHKRTYIHRNPNRY